MLNNGQHLLNVAEAAQEISMGSTPHYMETLVVVLLDLEDALTQSRNLTFDAPHMLPQIENQLLLVRNRIKELLIGIGPERVHRILEERAAYLRHQFIIH